MHTGADEVTGKQLATVSLAALGIVFGDIGTSPLYAIRECFHGEYGITAGTGNVLGVLSLIFWALLLIVALKYITFILKADNGGEGGVLALTALVKSKMVVMGKIKGVLVALGLFAACLLYGDGMITPAISVLSAVEGLGHVTPLFDPYIIPITLVILIGLFFLQKRGTARVGALFGPIILIWFCALAALGLVQIIRNPQVLRAVFPWHGIAFLINNRMHGFIVLGAVFLAVTGGEAIYADMGHFGRQPIRLTWFIVAFPALVLNYFGQGALLLTHPEATNHPFYAMVPHWAIIPMVILATMSTIIASQAVITGAFSLTRQAIHLGYLPRLRITHTSIAHIGQIYVGPVNWLLMVCTIGLVVGFQSSSKLAAAYGVAVSTTMLVTTALFFVVAHKRWGWSLPVAGSLTVLFLVVDLAFFGANMTKILRGAWFPMMIAGLIYAVMTTWKRGSKILASKMKELTADLVEFLATVAADPPQRITGQAFFLARSANLVPMAMVQNVRHNKILHSEVYFLNICNEEAPRVPNLEKIKVDKLGSGIYNIIARFGFMEEPKISVIFALCQGQGMRIDMKDASFFLGRQKLTISSRPGMSKWRTHLFLFLSRNAMDAAGFFDIPSNQVIEVGAQLEL